jgi:hypothetical protein
MQIAVSAFPDAPSGVTNGSIAANHLHRFARVEVIFGAARRRSVDRRKKFCTATQRGRRSLACTLAHRFGAAAACAGIVSLLFARRGSACAAGVSSIRREWQPIAAVMPRWCDARARTNEGLRRGFHGAHDRHPPFVKRIRCFLRGAVVIGVQCTSIRDCTVPTSPSQSWLGGQNGTEGQEGKESGEEDKA